jgi:hypothetical protein
VVKEIHAILLSLAIWKWIRTLSVGVIATAIFVLVVED